MPFTIGSLFSGYGGLDMGVAAALPGAEVAWHAEIEPAACRLLEHRFPDVPNLGDISRIDWSTAPHTDVLTGGFPCQDLSLAGRRLGLRPDTRSGLWEHMAYAVDQLRPALVVIENVRGLLSARAHRDLGPDGEGLEDPGVLRALGAVLGDLADLGYDAAWLGLRAADVGAPHSRFRVFITAWPTGGGPSAAHSGSSGRERGEPDGDRAGWDPAFRGETGDHARRGGAAPLAAAADSDRGQPERRGVNRVLGGAPPAEPGEGLQRQWSGHPAGHRSAAAAADSDRGAGRGRADVEVGRPHRGAPAAGDRQGPRFESNAAAWGAYAEAVARWERVVGRAVPAPVEVGPQGGERLNPLAVEWMMGLPEGWVTRVPAPIDQLDLFADALGPEERWAVSRNEALKMLGNGVVPQQAAAAVAHLLAVAAPGHVLDRLGLGDAAAA